MKNKFILVVLLLFTLIKPKSLFCQNINEVFYCDSTIVYKLEKSITEILSDTVERYIIDSTNWTEIANKKVYSKIIYRSSISIDSFINLVEFDSQVVCVIKNYSYVFDYLISLGLDFRYDYYTRFEYMKNDNFYKDRLTSKEYRDKKRMLDLFFKIYEHYKLYYNRNESSNEIIKSLLKYGLYNFPLLTYNILKLNSPLDKDIYNTKLRKKQD